MACFGRGTDHGDHAVVVLGVGKADEVGDEVGNVLPVLGGVLDDTEFEGAVEVQRQAVLERLFTEQHVTLQEVAGDGVLGRPDNGQLFHFVGCGGHHDGTEGSEVDSNVKRLFGHGPTSVVSLMNHPLGDLRSAPRFTGVAIPCCMLWVKLGHA